MPFCVQCGAQLEDGAKFCTNCGAKQPESSAPVYTPPVTESSPEPETNYTYTPPASEDQNAAPAPGGYSYDPTVYGGESAKSGKKKGGKVVFILLAVLAVIAALIYLLAGKGGGKTAASDDPTLGLYTAQKAEMAGINVAIDSMWENGFTIELKDKGKAAVNVDGTKRTIKWTLDGEDFTLKGSGLDCSGTLSNGVLTLENVMDTGITLTFTKDGASLPAASAPAAAPAPASEYSWWIGDWYGWWVVYDAGGSYQEEGYANQAWDACATIESKGTDSGYIEIWDEDGDTVASADVSFEGGNTDKGCMKSVSGMFYNDEIENGEWVVDPSSADVAGFDDLICIHGYYAKPTNAEDWIEYYIFLRPWGTKWDDIAKGDTSGMIYPGDMLPMNYDSWYLPLIEAGSPMPENFDGLE